MRRFGDADEHGGKKKLEAWRIAIYGVIFAVLSILLAILQTSDVRVFGQIPNALLALVCAVGFVFGGGFGALFGLFSGIAIELLGGSGFSLTPILFVLCGFLCGELVDKILTSNFWSFMIFGAAAGVLREVFTLLHFGLISEKLSILELIKDVIIGEYFAYFLCLVPAYFTSLGIYLLFKGKDEGSRKVK